MAEELSIGIDGHLTLSGLTGRELADLIRTIGAVVDAFATTEALDPGRTLSAYQRRLLAKAHQAWRSEQADHQGPYDGVVLR